MGIVPASIMFVKDYSNNDRSDRLLFKVDSDSSRLVSLVEIDQFVNQYDSVLSVFTMSDFWRGLPRSPIISRRLSIRRLRGIQVILQFRSEKKELDRTASHGTHMIL
jgi:hypothetical protein